MYLLEICIDNFESAVKAEKAGANRLELCQDLSVGGLTPTAGFITVVKKLVSIPIYVLIRPRPGNFLYDTNEVSQMVEDIKIAKQSGADGLVFGALENDNNVDFNVCQQLLVASSGLPVTFHRAFDKILDKTKALEDVIQLGFQRILTSGNSEKAIDSIKILEDLTLQAKNRIIIMPGGGVRDDNILRIKEATKAEEFHSSGRTTDPLKKMHACSEEVIFNMRKILDSHT